jgi:hypothetical protein
MKPAYYYQAYIEKMTTEARDRFGRLLDALKGRPVSVRGKNCIDLDGSAIRMAVDDFSTILKELRKLK